MRAITNDELAEIATELAELAGAQLQDVQQTETELGLGFYHDRRMVWLWFDLDALRPLILKFEDRPPTKSKLTKPLLLFVRAHLTGRRLSSVAVNTALGRVLELDFHEPTGELKRLEARLFPHGRNVTVFAGEKSVSFLRPKDLPQSPTASSPHVPASARSSQDSASVRGWSQIRDEWLFIRRGRSAQGRTSGAPSSVDAGPPMDVVTRVASAPSSVEDRARREWEKAIRKKEQALVKMSEELASKSDPLWRLAGEWLKSAGRLDGVPAEFASRIDPTKSLSWNIENCFASAKESERKLAGAEERMRTLEAELEAIRTRGVEGFAETVRQKTAQAAARGALNRQSTPSLLEKAGARGRKQTLGEDLEAYIGKSAADNLALLRRAQPHDLWLHLRDYPGAHAILRRPKNRSVTDKELNEIGRWVVMQSLHKSQSELDGSRYDMILAECRHVKPIKGDKLGRVTYQNDRLFVVRF